MYKLIGVALLALLSFQANAVIVYDQTPNPVATLYHSSWWDPDGSDYDQYVWDNFTLVSNQEITRIDWRGGYDPAYFGAGGPVIDFTVDIWGSIAAGTQPDVTGVPLLHCTVGGNANETPAGTFNGTAMYDYSFLLPTPFAAVAGTKYWVQIEAWQHGIPDWGLATGAGGNLSYFRRITNTIGDIMYQTVPGDAAFTLRNAVVLPADLNADGIVDILDLLDFSQQWLMTGILTADIYPDPGDQVVNLLDLAVFASNWLKQ